MGALLYNLVIKFQLLRHHLRRSQFAAVQDVSVYVRGHGDRAVAEKGGDHFEVDAAGQHEGGVGMAEGVQSDVGE